MWQLGRAAKQPNSSWLDRQIARGRSASGASLSAISRNLHSAIKPEIWLFAESRLAPRTID
jgi:hypothetical protein